MLGILGKKKKLKKTINTCEELTSYAVLPISLLQAVVL